MQLTTLDVGGGGRLHLQFRRAGKQAALPGFLAGPLASLFISFGREWFGMEKSLSFVWVVPLPFLVGLALAGLLAYCFPRPPKSSVQGLTLGQDRVADGG